MAELEASDELFKFQNSGVYRFDKTSNVIFVDPVRLLNRSYTRFKLSPSMYYSRFLDSKAEADARVSQNNKKRKRKERKLYCPNEREHSADKRHQEARPFLLRAHEALLEDKALLWSLFHLNNGGSSSVDAKEDASFGIEKDVKQSFIELGSVWQAPLYEITLHFRPLHQRNDDSGSGILQCDKQEVVSLFNNLVINSTSNDVEAEFLNSVYVVPKESCFYMSDLEQIHNLVPAEQDYGFNLIVIDPPWENGSARQKSMYPTLPNRFLLSLPIKQLTHTEGALVALWVTNREKLRIFVEKELFPAWGVSSTALLYWLKVKADGSLISELDLFHHRPYECLLLGYSHGVAECLSTSKPLEENHVVISIPGDYSRKPPVGNLLLDYAPGPKPARCVELFARELLAGWTSWGNEPLHFQQSGYFVNRTE